MEAIHCHIKIITRSKGASAVAAAAYRSGELLRNEYDGLTHDYTRKRGIIHTEITLPSHAPKQYNDRSTLWNSVEQIDKNSNSQLAREIEFALPNEFDRDNQIRLVREYVNDNFVSEGMCADFALHDKKDGNPHAHVMLTMRPLADNGEWGAKSKKMYTLDREGNKIPLKSGKGYKSRHVNLTNWDDSGNAEKWREQWAAKCNEEFQRLGLDKRVTHKSYERQGIDQQPTIHLGKNAHQMERRGERSMLGDINRAISEENQKYEKAVSVLNEEIAALYGDKKLGNIRNEYIDLAVQIGRQTNDMADLSIQFRNICGQMEDLDERSRILSAPTAAPATDRARLMREQAIKALQRDYKIMPEEIPAKYNELREAYTTVKQQQDNMPDIETLRKKLGVLEERYIQQYAATPPLVKTQAQNSQIPTNRSLSEQMAARNAQRRLDKATAPKQTQERKQGQEQSQEHDIER